MGDFEDKCSTISNAGLLSLDVDDEVEIVKAHTTPVESILRPIDVKKIIKHTSVYGKNSSTIKNKAKAEMAILNIEIFALTNGWMSEQVRRVMDEFNAWVGRFAKQEQQTAS